MGALGTALKIGLKLLNLADDPAKKHARIVGRRLRSREDLRTAINKGDLAAINKRIAQSRISLRKYKAAR